MVVDDNDDDCDDATVAVVFFADFCFMLLLFFFLSSELFSVNSPCRRIYTFGAVSTTRINTKLSRKFHVQFENFAPHENSRTVGIQTGAGKTYIAWPYGKRFANGII